MKIARLLFLSILCAFALPSFAQLNVTNVDQGPYTPGSTIASTFSIGNSSCITPGNIFTMYLSDANGNFSSETAIGTYNGFYSTFVNGKIPTGTPAGTGYRVRIKSTTPVLVSAPSSSFEVKTGTIIEAKLTSNAINIGFPETFGLCDGRNNTNFIFTNESTIGASVTADFTNELNGGSPVNISFNTQFKTFTAQLAHYTVFTKAQMPDGTIATKAYFLINNENITAFATKGNSVVCLPDGAFEFNVITDNISGIGRNFPGDTYMITWGDKTSSTHTICDIKQTSGTISHIYTESSCGTVVGNQFNVFPIVVSSKNPYCGDIGTPISTTAKVVVKPINVISGPTNICTNVDVTFNNASMLGENPNTNTPGCIPNNAVYNWYVDGVLVAPNKTRTFNLTYKFLTHGSHTIKLESVTSGICDADPTTRTICVQDPPKPAFNLSATEICKPGVIKTANNSVIDEICNANNTFLWNVTGGPFTYTNNTSATSKNPEFLFDTEGIYEVSLSVITESCGTVTTSAPQTIVVNTTPTISLSPDIELCNLATYSFSNTTTGPTKTIFTGTAKDALDTYTWTVTGGNYKFVNSDLHSKYPEIQFLDYAAYSITVAHKNICSTVTATQKILFSPAPVVAAGSDQSICYNDATVTLTGTITGTTTGFTWVNGTGTFSPNRNTLNATYTPTVAERNAGQVNLILRATTSLPQPCNSIDDEVIIFIKPSIAVSSSATKTICTGTSVDYTPTSTPAGATFTWTATGSTNAAGFTTSGTGNITTIINNTDPNLNATVVYTITPTLSGCIGTPFTFTVTVTPNPILKATATASTICNQQRAVITLDTNIPGSKFTWTSTAETGVSGNSANVTPTSALVIDDQLFNNTTTTKKVTYTITPITAVGCIGVPIQVDIFIDPSPTPPNAGADKTICTATTYTLTGNTPIVGTGKWTEYSTIGGVTFDDDTKPNATVSGLKPGNIYIFRWTISGSPNCASQASNVTITVAPPSVGGTANGSTTVCAGGNSGAITLIDYVGTILGWETSPNGATWTGLNPASTNATITFAGLTATTYYRAIVQSGNCSSAISAPAIVTVNQGAVTANAGPNQFLCNATSTLLAGNSPGTNTGIWSILSGPTTATFTNPTLANTEVTNLIPGQTYVFRWTISGLAPCPPTTSDVTIRVDLPSNGGVAVGVASVCAGSSNGQITLVGYVGAIIGWETSVDGGLTWTRIPNTTSSQPYLNLNITTRYRAVVQNGSCPPAFSTVVIITVNLPVTVANAGPDQSLCNATSTTLTGNIPSLLNTGAWTLTSGQTGVTITNPSLSNTTVTGLVGGETYTFKWTITGLLPCPPTTDDVTITNLAPLQNNSITTLNTTTCNGQTITVSGSLPIGGNNSYTYSWQSSVTGSAPWNTITGQTGRDLTFTASSTLSYRRIITSGNCTSTSNIITITVLPAITGNTISGTQAICLTKTPNSLAGSIPAGGDGSNYTYRWEQSIDDGTTWTAIAGAITQNYSPPAITQTTSYRRIITSSACSGSSQSISNTIKITVNLNAKAEFTYVTDLECIPFKLDATNIKGIPYPAQNGIYSWYADNVLIGNGVNFPGYTIATENTSVTIKLVVTSSLGCLQDEMSHVFRTRQNVIASFTQDVTSGCGPLSVAFKNTSTTLTGVNFEWSIDNNVVSKLADPGTFLFLADPSGEDKIYNVSLKVTTLCGTYTFTSKVTVIAQPIAAFKPSIVKGCSPLTVVFTNTSPGATNSYQYDFDDGTVSPGTTSKAAVTHTFTTVDVKDFKVKLTATNGCGSDDEVIIIRVSPNNITPALVVGGNQLRGCAPFTVNFTNNTIGASKYLYTFEPGVTRFSETTFPEKQSYTFTKSGTYRVTLVASNDCATNSDFVDITVDPQPTAAFIADRTIGCTGLSVKFTNSSVGAKTYKWDFGDGTFSDAAAPTHVYADSKPTHTVTLTAVNEFGCSSIKTIADYIKIVGPPKAAFSINPAATITIPDYTFKFKNESNTDAQTFKWSFGDGDFSTLKDPTHTYADTGKHLVILRAYNQTGCVDSVEYEVQILGIPGYLYVPNSFMPGGTSSPLKTFIPLGAGIASWRMSVFNKWGQVIWETTKLDDGKPVEGWDGTFNNLAQPQGIYFWKIDVKLVNGSEWKGMTYDNSPPRRTGQIYLIR